MTFRRTLLLGALASCSFLLAGVTARADYSFSTSNGGSTPFGTASTLILTGQPTSQGTLFGQGQVNIQDVEISTSNPGITTDFGAIPFTFTLTLNQTAGHGSTGAGSVTTTFSGSLSISRSDVGGEQSLLTTLTNANPTIITIGNTSYTLSGMFYAPPVVNSAPNSVGAGNISVLITPVSTPSVPEPASVAMLGTGLLTVLGLAVCRAKKA